MEVETIVDHHQLLWPSLRAIILVASTQQLVIKLSSQYMNTAGHLDLLTMWHRTYELKLDCNNFLIPIISPIPHSPPPPPRHVYRRPTYFMLALEKCRCNVKNRKIGK